MCAMASQITSLAIVCSIVCSGADKKKHQSSASLAFVWRIHRWPVNSPHKWPVTRKMFPFDDVIMVTCKMLSVPSSGLQLSIACTGWGLKDPLPPSAGQICNLRCLALKKVTPSKKCRGIGFSVNRSSSGNFFEKKFTSLDIGKIISVIYWHYCIPLGLALLTLS